MNRTELRSLVDDLKICEYNSDERRDFIERYNFRETIRTSRNGVPFTAMTLSALSGAYFLGSSLSSLAGLNKNSLLISDSFIGSIAMGAVVGSIFVYFTGHLGEKWKIRNIADNLRYRKEHGKDMSGLEGKDLDAL